MGQDPDTGVQKPLYGALGLSRVNGGGAPAQTWAQYTGAALQGTSVQNFDLTLESGAEEPYLPTDEATEPTDTGTPSAPSSATPPSSPPFPPTFPTDSEPATPPGPPTGPPDGGFTDGGDNGDFDDFFPRGMGGARPDPASTPVPAPLPAPTRQ